MAEALANKPYLHRQHLLHILPGGVGDANGEVVVVVVRLQTQRQLALGRVRVGAVVEELVGVLVGRVDPESVQQALAQLSLLARVQPPGAFDDEVGVQRVA